MVHSQCTYIIQVHFDLCNIICLRPLQQNFIHFIKMTIEFDDKMPHLDYKQLGRVGGWHWAVGNGTGIPYIMTFIEMCCCTGKVGFSSSVIETRGLWNSVSVMGTLLETKYRIRVFGLLLYSEIWERFLVSRISAALGFCRLRAPLSMDRVILSCEYTHL